MQKKILKTGARALLNTLILGVTAAAAIFTVYTLKATGEKMIGTLAEDIGNIRGNEEQCERKAA